MLGRDVHGAVEPCDRPTIEGEVGEHVLVTQRGEELVLIDERLTVEDDTAVAAWNIKNGVNGSIPTAFTAEAPITYGYTADISSNALIQDKTKLKAVALLIDRTTGDIVNAAQCAINDYTTGIGDITSEADSTPVARFSVDGRQLSAPQKGLNIIKTADGRTLKVFVK